MECMVLCCSVLKRSFLYITVFQRGEIQFTIIQCNEIEFTVFECCVIQSTVFQCGEIQLTIFECGEMQFVVMRVVWEAGTGCRYPTPSSQYPVVSTHPSTCHKNLVCSGIMDRCAVAMICNRWFNSAFDRLQMNYRWTPSPMTWVPNSPIPRWVWDKNLVCCAVLLQ